MGDITSVADKLGMTMELDAVPFGPDGLSTANLVDFYKKHGFEVDMTSYGGDFATEGELIRYAISEKEPVPMTRKPKAAPMNILFTRCK
jgi:hypothetical protein